MTRLSVEEKLRPVENRGVIKKQRKFKEKF